jgi:hypothetical protein
MRALESAQHNPASVLDDYRTTFSQRISSSYLLSFPLGTTLYKARFTNALSLYHCIFNCIYLVPNCCILNVYLASGCRFFLEKKRNGCCSCGDVVLYNPSFAVISTSSTVHGQRLKPAPELSHLLIRSVTYFRDEDASQHVRIFAETVINRQLRIRHHLVTYSTFFNRHHDLL